MLKYIFCLSIAFISCINAVTIQNESSYDCVLSNSSSISHKELYLEDFILKPGEKFTEDDIASITISVNKPPYQFRLQNLEDANFVVIRELDNNIQTLHYKNSTCNKGSC
jgi:hypothetical protein